MWLCDECWYFVVLQVFAVLAFCPPEPVPMNVIYRFLGMCPDSDSDELDVIRNCDLLTRSVPGDDSYNAVEKVSVSRRVHRSLRAVFCDSEGI